MLKDTKTWKREEKRSKTEVDKTIEIHNVKKSPNKQTSRNLTKQLLKRTQCSKYYLMHKVNLWTSI